MDIKLIVALGIRIAAIFLIIFIIRDGSAFIYQLVTYKSDNNWIIFAASILSLFLLFAILLLKFPLSFAGAILPKTKSESVEIKSNIEDIQVIAFTIVGLFVLVRAVPDMFYWLIVAQQYNNNMPPIELRPEDFGNIVSTILELIIGFWLLLGAKGLQELLHKFRYAGIDK